MFNQKSRTMFNFVDFQKRYKATINKKQKDALIAEFYRNFPTSVAEGEDFDQKEYFAITKVLLEDERLIERDKIVSYLAKVAEHHPNLISVPIGKLWRSLVFTL